MTLLIEHQRHAIFIRTFKHEGKIVRHVPVENRFHYLIGETKPNYPLPAIPLACAIFPDLVQIAEVFWLEDWLETQDTLPIQMAEFELVAEFEKE